MININIMSVCKVSAVLPTLFLDALIQTSKQLKFSCLKQLLSPIEPQVHFSSWTNPEVLIVVSDCSDWCVK